MKYSQEVKQDKESKEASGHHQQGLTRDLEKGHIWENTMPKPEHRVTRKQMNVAGTDNCSKKFSSKKGKKQNSNLENTWWEQDCLLVMF